MKALKIIVGILLALLLIAVAAMVSLATFVSPNRFKPLVVEQVKKATGRDLTLDGDLSWTIFPTLGLKVGHLELANPAGFKQKTFAEMDSATISVKLIPLFHGKIKSSGIILSGLKLNLIKNANGKTNWEDLKKPASSEEAATIETAPASPKKTALGLTVSGVDISNATIHWENEQAKQSFLINKFELHSKNITFDQPIPLETSFNFEGTNPNVKGQVKLTCDISLNLDTQIYALHKMNLNAKIHQDTKNFAIVLKGDAVADMSKEKIQLDNLIAQMDDLKLQGKATVTDLSDTPKTVGHLQIQPLNVKQWLKNTGQDVSSLEKFSNLSGDFDFTAGTTLQSVNLKGTLRVDELRSSKVTVTNVNVRTQLQKGELTLAPITGDFYQGTITGDAKVNLNNAVPQISMSGKLSNMQAEALMADLAPTTKIKMTGAGNVDFQITTSGTSGDVITKNLNGTAKLNFNNGVLKGIDIGYLLDSAYSLVRRGAMSGNDTNQTAFGTLSATANIHNGVVTNDDLKLDANRFDASGRGTINLISQQLKYQLQSSVKKTADERNNLSNLYGMPIPIMISGDLSNPSISLDTDTLMKAIAQQQLEKAKDKVKEKIQEKFQDQLNDKLQKGAGDLLNNLLGN